MQSRTDKFLDLIWSPLRDDEFIAYGNDLYLYKVKNSSSQSNNAIKLFDESYAELIGSYSEHSNPRLVAWCLNKERPCMFAVSFQNSKIQLINLNQSNSKKTSVKNFEIIKEFSLKQVRHCNNMSWSPYNANYLAAGFERIRNEHSILVWDVISSTTIPTFKFDTETVLYSTDILAPSNTLLNNSMSKYNLSSLTTSMHTGSSSNSQFQAFKPVYETGSSETCNSLQWDSHRDNYLLASLTGKSLKIFDIKVNMKAVSSVNTKYVNSFSAETAPNSSQYQACSYYENTVALWDLRMFDKPVDLINETDSIIKTQWCPTKPGKLAVLSKNQAAINVYTIGHLNSSSNTNVLEDENVPKQIIIDKISVKNSNIFKKDLSKTTSSVVTNFSWYSFDSNKIIGISNSIMTTICLSDTIVLSFAPTTGDFFWSSNLGKLNMIESIDQNEFDFINELKSRTKLNYGLKYEIISIANGTATSVPSSFSSYNSNILPNNNTGLTAHLNLALSLNSFYGINTLIRSDFLYNPKTCNTSNTNSELTSNVRYLWEWFESINRLFEKIIPINSRNNDFSSVSRNIFMDLYWSRYSGLKALLEDFIAKRPAKELQPSHDERFKLIAYNMCNWDFKDGSLTKQFFNNLENNNKIERAACLACLTQNYEQALEILDTASKSDARYGCLWIAFKYFTNEQILKESSKLSNSSLHHSPQIISQQNSILNKTNHQNSNSTDLNVHLNDSIIKECNTLIENFNNPYLKALFNYILNGDDSIEKILRDRTISFQDRIALSVFFMYNNKQKDLLKFFDYLIVDECFNNADLHGILLTGLNKSSIDLFQAFIEKFSDIQTVSLAIIHTPYIDVLQSKQVQYWINCYRDLLNKFKLWEMRAEFDLFKMKLVKSQNILTVNSLNENEIINGSKLNNQSQAPAFIRQNSQNNLSAQRPHHLALKNNQFSLNSYNVHLLCNKCGKNLLEKTPLTVSVNDSNQLLYRQASQYSNHILSQKSITYKSNDQTLNGCLHCSSFLPQCTVCLKLMKINMSPSSNSNSSFNQSQSLYATTPISLFNAKSPTIQINKSQVNNSSNIPNSTDLNLQCFSELDEQIDEGNKQNKKEHAQHRLKSSQQADNILFLNNSKFGNWFSWCQTCKHGGHNSCLIQYWFKNSNKCPFLHCKCTCLNIDHHIN